MRRAAGPVCVQGARPLAKLMKVAVAAVVEMAGTWSDRMVFICRPIPNAFRPSMM